MGQKINPVSLRLQSTNRHFDTSWSSSYFYKQLVTKDLFLQSYFNNFLKLLKLPSGRYSIQHLQKKTQVFNFLCYSKSTREWRSRLFGLTPRNRKLKKNRYFFKTIATGKHAYSAKLSSKKKRFINSKLKSFYTSLNQLEIYKIQKKITSFQNRTLWSKLLKQGEKPVVPFFSLLESQTSEKKKFVLSRPFLKRNEYKLPSSVKQSFFPITTMPIEMITLPTRRNDKLTHFKSQNHLVSGTLFNSSLVKNEREKLKSSSSFQLFLTRPVSNSNLLFLENLLVYKTLKSNPVPVPIFQIGMRRLQKKTLGFKYKNYLESSLFSFYQTPIDLTCFRVKQDWQYASYLADEIVYFLEKRVPFRRIKTKLFKQLSKISSIRGVRITCSGRVGGKSKKAQRAKTECLKYGQTSLHVFSSPIDFSCKTASTSFGSVGVKVWICYH